MPIDIASALDKRRAQLLELIREPHRAGLCPHPARDSAAT